MLYLRCVILLSLFGLILSFESGSGDEKGLNPPTDVRVTVLSPQSIGVLWRASLYIDVTGYFISYTTAVQYARSGTATIYGANTTSFIITNLEENTLYTVAVQTIDINNRTSLKCNEASATTWTDVPSSPPVIQRLISVNPASIQLQLQYPPEVHHNGPLLAHVIQYYTSSQSRYSLTVSVAGGLSHTIVGLNPYASYSIQAATMNINGTGPFSNSVVKVSGEARPSMPRLLVAQDVTYSSVTLTWLTPSSPNGIVLQYELLHRKTFNGFYTPFVELSLNSTNINYTLTGLTSYTKYQIRVRAVNSFATGLSAEVAIFTGISPPTNVTGKLKLPQSIVVTWTLSSSSNVTGYLISYTAVPNIKFKMIRVEGANSTQYIIDDLEELTLYIITLQATSSSNGTSVHSNGISVTTKSVAPTVTPTNVILTSDIPASLNISWKMLYQTEYNISITGVEIRYTRYGSNDSRSVIVTNGTTHKLSGLTAFAFYFIEVAFIALNKTGQFTAPMIHVSGEDKPTAPKLLGINNVEQDKVEVHWTEPDPPNGRILKYVLQYRRLDAPFLTVSINGNRTMHTVKDLDPDTDYQFTVKACTIVGCGPNITSIFQTTCHSDNGALTTMIATATTHAALLTTEMVVCYHQKHPDDNTFWSVAGIFTAIMSAGFGVAISMVNYFVCDLSGSDDTIAIVIAVISVVLVVAVLIFTIAFACSKKK